jgi:hypothetical protein
LQHESRCFAHSPVLDPSEQRAEVLAAASHSVRIEARSALDRAIHQAVQHVREHTAERVDEEIAARVPGASARTRLRSDHTPARLSFSRTKENLVRFVFHGVPIGPHRQTLCG